jgi:hypothetical protein
MCPPAKQPPNNPVIRSPSPPPKPLEPDELEYTHYVHPNKRGLPQPPGAPRLKPRKKANDLFLTQYNQQETRRSRPPLENIEQILNGLKVTDEFLYDSERKAYSRPSI